MANPSFEPDLPTTQLQKKALPDALLAPTFPLLSSWPENLPSWLSGTTFSLALAFVRIDDTKHFPSYLILLSRQGKVVCPIQASLYSHKLCLLDTDAFTFPYSALLNGSPPCRPRRRPRLSKMSPNSSWLAEPGCATS